MRSGRVRVAALVVCLALPARGALACRISFASRDSAHGWPGRLVDDATAIARVRAVGPVGPPPGPHAYHGDGTMAFAVLEWIRPPAGARPDSLAFAGSALDRDDFNRDSVPYTFVRSDGGHGDCYAYGHRVGAEYLVLLRPDRYGRGLSPWWALLAPVDEQVRGADDPWVAWVRARAGKRRPA